MPSVVPLRNPLAQNAVDFNNQALTNSGNFFKYKTGANLNNAAYYSADLNDINSIITCDTNSAFPTTAILDIGLLSTTNGRNINPGAEIILYTSPTSVLTNIKVINSSGFSIISEGAKNYTIPAYAGTAKLTLVDKDSNNWLFSGNIGGLVQYSFTNCCGDQESFYQINSNLSSDINNVNTLAYFFDGVDSTKPYNGIYYDGSNWQQVVNGTHAGSASCSAYNFNTSYTFYTVLNDYTSAVVAYSISSVDMNQEDPNSLIGYRFFNDPQIDVYPCQNSATIADGTYYTTTGTYSLEFYKGYVISYAAL